MTDFDAIAAPWIFDAEGGYVDSTIDRGGATKYGISLRYLREVADGDIDLDGDIDSDDIRALDRDQALRLYRRDYWDVNGCDVLPAGLALCLFDAAVHHGGLRGRKLVQQGLGVAPDGIFGPRTLARIQALDHDSTWQRKAVVEYGAQRAVWLCRIIDADPSQRAHITGWYRRLMRLVSVALSK